MTGQPTLERLVCSRSIQVLSDSCREPIAGIAILRCGSRSIFAFAGLLKAAVAALVYLLALSRTSYMIDRMSDVVWQT